MTFHIPREKSLKIANLFDTFKFQWQSKCICCKAANFICVYRSVYGLRSKNCFYTKNVVQTLVLENAASKDHSQKMKFSIKEFFSKCDQRSHLLKKSILGILDYFGQF